MAIFSFRREPYRLGLWFSDQETWLIEREQGLVCREAACLVRPVMRDRPLQWGNKALLTGRASPLWQIGWQASEIKAYLQAFLCSLLPPDRCHLMVMVPNLRDPYYRAFWQLLGEQLHVSAVETCSPLTCLAGLPEVQGSELLLVLEDGIAECASGFASDCPMSVGYGHYLSRRLIQYIYLQYGLRVEEAPARMAWQRLGGLAQIQDQITLQGQDLGGNTQYLLLTAEELYPLAEAAFQPLVQLCRWQIDQAATQGRPLSGLRLFGREAQLPGLSAYLSQQLQQEVIGTMAEPDIMGTALYRFLNKQG